MLQLLRLYQRRKRHTRKLSKEQSLISQKELEYLRRLGEHQARVYLIWLELRDVLGEFFTIHPEMALNIEHRIRVHDQSRYLPDEFLFCRQKYFPYKGERLNRAGFAKASRLHVQRNDHHPEHWVKEDGTYFMPENKDNILCALLEMCCDWEEISIYHGCSALYFFKRSRKDIFLNPAFDSFVENVLQRLELVLYSEGWFVNCTTFRSQEELDALVAKKSCGNGRVNLNDFEGNA